jgi:demethylmenaquinone methyltransferase/2-methoxy-6-polyprenyl-1,4-benzoquinol methylase
VSNVIDNPWAVEGQEKREAVQQMFGEIAPTYDLLNSAMSLRLHHKWRSIAVGFLGLQPGDSALDLCCGTGDFSVPVRKAVGEKGLIVGIDFSQPMLCQAVKKSEQVNYALGDACRLPLRENVFKAVTVGWGLRNVQNLEEALSEIRRVLKPGGRLVSVDMSIPRSRIARGLSRGVSLFLFPMLGSLFGHRKAYTYLPKSTEKFCTPEELQSLMVKLGFRTVQYKFYFMGNICIHVGEK